MREQLCTLTYSELNALSARLAELAEHTLASRVAQADMRQAARAMSDLASTRFAIAEIAESTHDGTTADELRKLIGGAP